MISINEQTYLALKDLGKTADSFNDVIANMLKNNTRQPEVQT
jgi:predicted CopG family antitoxin